MSLQLGHIVVTRHGRTTRIQRCTDEQQYQALRIFGVRESVAAAVTARLVTINLKASNEP